MPAGSAPPRHRAPRAARTPLSDAVTAATDGLGSLGRRTAVAAGASGLVVSMLAVPASAAPGEHPSLPTVDTAALAASARDALAVSPVVSVPTEATWAFDVPAITVVADPPPPPPAPAPAPSSSSRSAARAPIGAAAPASADGNAIVEIASRYVGVPYLWGGTTPDGFDCSGFTSYVFAQAGITLPRTSADQRYAGTEVPADQALPGDLVWSPGHVAIYAGGNLQVDSPQPGGTVQIREIYQSNPVFIRVG